MTIIGFRFYSKSTAKNETEQSIQQKRPDSRPGKNTRTCFKLETVDTINSEWKKLSQKNIWNRIELQIVNESELYIEQHNMRCSVPGAAASFNEINSNEMLDLIYINVKTWKYKPPTDHLLTDYLFTITVFSFAYAKYPHSFIIYLL